MLVELRTKSQVTIPKEIVARLGLSEGDQLDIREEDGAITLVPVAIYPKKYLNDLEQEIRAVKAKLAAGEQPVFDSVDAMLQKLEGE
mgnify:CR=1 FL=1